MCFISFALPSRVGMRNILIADKAKTAIQKGREKMWKNDIREQDNIVADEYFSKFLRDVYAIERA